MGLNAIKPDNLILLATYSGTSYIGIRSIVHCMEVVLISEVKVSQMIHCTEGCYIEVLLYVAKSYSLYKINAYYHCHQ